MLSLGGKHLPHLNHQQLQHGRISVEVLPFDPIEQSNYVGAPTGEGLFRGEPDVGVPRHGENHAEIPLGVVFEVVELVEEAEDATDEGVDFFRVARYLDELAVEGEPVGLGELAGGLLAEAEVLSEEYAGRGEAPCFLQGEAKSLDYLERDRRAPEYLLNHLTRVELLGRK